MLAAWMVAVTADCSGSSATVMVAGGLGELAAHLADHQVPGDEADPLVRGSSR